MRARSLKPGGREAGAHRPPPRRPRPASATRRPPVRPRAPAGPRPRPRPARRWRRAGEWRREGGGRGSESAAKNAPAAPPPHARPTAAASAPALRRGAGGRLEPCGMARAAAEATHARPAAPPPPTAPVPAPAGPRTRLEGGRRCVSKQRLLPGPDHPAARALLLRRGGDQRARLGAGVRGERLRPGLEVAARVRQHATQPVQVHAERLARHLSQRRKAASARLAPCREGLGAWGSASFFFKQGQSHLYFRSQRENVSERHRSAPQGAGGVVQGWARISAWGGARSVALSPPLVAAAGAAGV